jgi:hypothetical protein
MALFKEKEIKQDKKKNAFEVPPIQPRQTQPIQNENNNQFNIQTIKTPQINPNLTPSQIQ